MQKLAASILTPEKILALYNLQSPSYPNKKLFFQEMNLHTCNVQTRFPCWFLIKRWCTEQSPDCWEFHYAGFAKLSIFSTHFSQVYTQDFIRKWVLLDDSVGLWHACGQVLERGYLPRKTIMIIKWKMAKSSNSFGWFLTNIISCPSMRHF